VNMTEQTTVLVVEDEESFIDALTVGLKREGFRVQVARDGAQALDLFDAVNPDLVLLDVMLPRISGIDVCRQLRKRSQVPIIMVTAKGAEIDTVVGLEVGADDYITKPFSTKELVARIRALLRRRKPHHGQAPVEIAGLRIDPVAHRVSGNGQPLSLGPTEFRLLHYFMTHPNRVYTRTQLMDEIWGDQVIIEERTVDVHIRRLRQALSPSAHDALIETVRGRGYALRTEPIAVGKA